MTNSGKVGNAGRFRFGRSVRPLAEVLEARELLATITVNTTADADGADGSATLSLRQAIEISNGSLAIGSLSMAQQALVTGPLVASNTIGFAIPGTGPFTLSPTSPLPSITGPTVIDGYTQAGAHPNTIGPRSGKNTVLQIELNGSMAGPDASGLDLKSGASVVRGLAIGGFTNGLSIESGTILVQGNFLGLDATGTISRPNRDGIQGLGSFHFPNTIGGTAAGDGNVISGNTQYGLTVIEGDLLQGNFIGTDITGAKALPNGFDGIAFFSSESATIGGTVAGAGNLISGNTRNGISLQDSSVVQGNFIGTDVTGTKALPNGGDGIAAGGGTDTIGGTAAGAGNILSGNAGNGLSLQLNDYLVQGNFIGTDLTGTKAIPNGRIGLAVIPNSFVGDSMMVSIQSNVISGNAGTGLTVGGFSFVQGNFIGTDLTGTKPIPNGGDGIDVLLSGIVIGGAFGPSANVISGNRGNGVSTGDQTQVQGNFIGTDITGKNPLPNGGNGVVVSGNGNTIGGTIAGAGNFIGFNNGEGIVVSEPGTSVPQNNTISRNSIFANAGLGIDLGGDGVTPNIPGGSPTGPNRLQPYPVLIGASFNGLMTSISGTLGAARSTTYTVEFFSNPAADASGFGQGRTFIGSVIATTDALGHADFSIAIAPGLELIGQAITATATDPSGNTSEFARDITVGLGSPTTTTILAQSTIATLGRPTTFAALVGGNPGVLPTGLVSFLEDGFVIGFAPVGPSGVAVFITDRLGPGPHAITAQYAGDPGDLSSLSSAVAVSVFDATAFGGPSVTSDVFTGANSVTITFNRGLTLGPAQDPTNFAIVGPDHKTLTIKSAVYGPKLATVTLTTLQKLDPHKTYQLTINGQTGNRVVDVFGIPLNGQKGGKPGHNFVGKIQKAPVVKVAHPAGPKAKAKSH